MEGAVLKVGNGTDFNYGAAVTAFQSIVIGERCMIGSRVLITDRTEDAAGPVELEDDVWLAHGVVVLPGVRIGRGSAVAAGTIVRVNVPPDSLVIGSPARCLSLRSLER
jgi:maltose O-acetyltransferase